MDDEPFGISFLGEFDVGDLVYWNEWCDKKQKIIKSCGFITKIYVKLSGGRSIYVADVVSNEQPIRKYTFFITFIKKLTLETAKNV